MGAGEGGPKRQESLRELPDSPGDPMGASTPKQDHSQALAEISRNHQAALVRFLTVRTGSVEDAKEIVQEAFAKILALDRPGTISLLAGYLWRTAVNLAIDRKRQRAIDERYRRDIQQPVEREEPSAESMVETRQRLAIVERAINELPPRCAEAFVLHVLQGHTFEEVGHKMGISSRMAIKHVSRALEYLQTCLDAADVTRSRR